MLLGFRKAGRIMYGWTGRTTYGQTGQRVDGQMDGTDGQQTGVLSIWPIRSSCSPFSSSTPRHLLVSMRAMPMTMVPSIWPMSSTSYPICSMGDRHRYHRPAFAKKIQPMMGSTVNFLEPVPELVSLHCSATAVCSAMKKPGTNPSACASST